MAYEFTPARRLALEKARAKSALVRHAHKKTPHRRRYTSDRNKRGIGKAGLQKNFVPYARANKGSQTLGINAGTIIPGTGKRVAFGGYVRLENIKRNGSAIDKALAKVGGALAPTGTKRGSARRYLKQNVHIDNPGIRASFGKAQVRLGTSRGAGPTVIIRRGKHKSPYKKSFAGIKKFDTRMRTVRNTKRRPQRRGIL